MATRCNFCGEDAVVSETDGSFVSMRVCQECGSIDKEHYITEENSFSRQYDNTSAHDFKQTLSRTARNALSVSIPQGLKAGKNRIRIIGQTFKMGAPIIEDATNLYERLFKHPDVINKTITNKLLLAAACMYIMMRQSNIPVSIRWFCKVSDLFVNDFSSNFLLVLRAMDITLIYPSIGSRIADVLAPAKLNSKIINLTREIIELCEKAWLVSGRSHSPIIIAAAHIAWYTLSEHMGRKSSLRDFCREYKFSLPGTVADRSKEIHDTVFELGKTLPWVTGNYKDKKLFNRKYLPAIVKYRESLLHKHKIEVSEKYVPVINVKTEVNPVVRGEEGKFDSSVIKNEKHALENLMPQTVVEQEQNSREIEINICQSSPGCPNEGKNSSKPSDVCNKSSEKSSENPSSLTELPVVVYESDSVLRKNLFIPPILKKPRKRIYYEAMEDGEGLHSDDELTDAQEKDVDQYIRSVDEINLMRNVKQSKKEVVDPNEK
ncbi:transcription factor IIIB 50 kDa subunit-like [Ostrea edulis]|uniref:transcription factor IIIB 50 kDa subunit-like n=1 Tax=Ostrea edulis TaxID=37623 RepID=UPI0024AEABA0|nr:transcription factor IIIB 50 kDa subunit-like [Ostrea edulis]XP_056004739.1 transcription factor IIIB 50 kDa subunit-like [Ostrea edulis]